jgi:hypothetical protein
LPKLTLRAKYHDNYTKGLAAVKPEGKERVLLMSVVVGRLRIPTSFIFTSVTRVSRRNEIHLMTRILPSTA